MKTFKKIIMVCLIISLISISCIGAVSADTVSGTKLIMTKESGPLSSTFDLVIEYTDMPEPHTYEWFELENFSMWDKIGETTTDRFTVTISDTTPKVHCFKCRVNGIIGESNWVYYQSYGAPHAFLIGSPEESKELEEVQFHVTTDVPVKEYLWDFGDGTTSNEESPIHKYETAGSYTYSVVVANECGSDTATAYIDVYQLKNKTYFDITQKFDLKNGSTMSIFIILMLVFAGLFLFYIIASKGHISMPILVAFMLVIAVAFIIILVGGTFSGISLDRFG